MAQLTNGKLTLEIAYVAFDDGTVYYDILWRWGTVPIINEEAIYGIGDTLMPPRRPGAFRMLDWASDDQLVDAFASAMESQEITTHTADHPSVTFVVGPYPIPVPFESSTRRSLAMLDDPPTRKQQRLRKALGTFPEDLFEVIMFVDAHVLGDSPEYFDSGLCLKLVVPRREVFHFVTELRAEWVEFEDRYAVGEWLDREHCSAARANRSVD